MDDQLESILWFFVSVLGFGIGIIIVIHLVVSI